MDKWFIPMFRIVFPTVAWYGPDSSVYLTFDDGPHPVATPLVLDILRKERIKATFFLVGNHALRHPDIVEMIMKDGHTIGNHTMTHHRVWFSDQKTLEREIEGAQSVLEKVTGKRPTMFRPPHSRIDPLSVSYLDAIGLRTVLFSVNTWDFLGHSVERVSSRVKRWTASGDIVAFHDNELTHQKIGAYLTRVIDVIRQKGLSFGTLD